jgi:hypothetical protein
MEPELKFCGEAEYQRWLNSALEAERRRLQLQITPRNSRPPALANEHVHGRREADKS